MTAQDTKVTQEDDMSEEGVRAPFALKFLVGALAVAIAVMLLLIVVKIMRGDHRKTSEVLATVKVAEPVKAVPSQNLMVKRPEGSELILSSVSASGEILLHFRGPAGDTLIIIDVNGTQRRLIVE